MLPLDEVISRYYVRLNVVDRPGTLGKIATLLGKARIGISSVILLLSRLQYATGEEVTSLKTGLGINTAFSRL